MSDRRYHVDGDLVPADEAAVSVRDAGFRRGDAATRTLRAYGGDVFAWDAHADRLRAQSEALGLEHGFSDSDLLARIRETLAVNDLADAAVRLAITRGRDAASAADLGLGGPTAAPDAAADPTVVVAVEPLSRGGREGERAWDAPATLQTVRTRHPSADALPPAARGRDGRSAVLARSELRRSAAAAAAGVRADADADGGGTTAAAPADEALMRDTDGRITGGARSAVFFVADDALRTPSLDGPVFPGVVRSVVLDLAREEGLPVAEGAYAPADVRDADEAFLTHPIAELRPVETVDGVGVEGGPMTTLLARLFDDRIERDRYGE